MKMKWKEKIENVYYIWDGSDSDTVLQCDSKFKPNWIICNAIFQVSKSVVEMDVG